MALSGLPIETPRLVLRPFVAGDAERVLALSREPSAREWLPSQVLMDRDDAISLLEHLIRHVEGGTDPRQGPCVLAIEHRMSGALIGHVGLSPLDGDAEIGFAIGESHRRQGLAAEAVAAASSWAIATFGLPRILGVTAAANVASQRTLARAGFVHVRDEEMTFQGTRQRVGVHELAGRCAPASAHEG